MQPLSIAAGSLITARADSIIRSDNRDRLTAVREADPIGANDANAPDAETNTQSPIGSAEVLSHSFLSLVPIDHPKANLRSADNVVKAVDRTDAAVQTYNPVHTEPWYPSVIYHNDFMRRTPYFHHIDLDDETVGVPSLILNWELFRSLWKLAMATRQLQGKQEWMEKERYRYSNLYRELYQRSEKEQKAIDDLQNVGEFRPGLWPELYRIGDIHEQNIAANNATVDRLYAEEERVIASYTRALTRVREAQDELWPFLDNLFGSLGVLPDSNNLDAPIEVPVIEPDLESDDAQFVEWPENNWNDDCNHPGWGSEGLESTEYHDPDAAWNDAWQEYSTEEPIKRLRLEVEDKRRDALNAKAEFDNFRGTYDEEFYKYLGRTPAAQAVAEKSFGPVWLEMSQAVTRRARDTEEAFYSAEERLSEAKRAAKLQIRAGASRDEISYVKVWDEAEVDNFGQMVPCRKRKHIDDWLEQETICTKKTKTQAIESRPSSRKRKHSDHSLEEEVSLTKIKTQAIEDEPSSCKRKHSDDILELTSSSKKIKIQATVDDDVIFDLSEHSADISVVEIADGYQRRKIDNYIRQAQAARPILPGRRFSDMSLCSATDEVELDAASVD